MTSQSAARTQDQTNDGEALADERLERPAWPGYVFGGVAVGIVFVLGAALVYRGILSALLHVVR